MKNKNIHQKRLIKLYCLGLSIKGIKILAKWKRKKPTNFLNSFTRVLILKKIM